MKIEKIINETVYHITAEPNMYITQAASTILIQHRIYAKELYMNVNTSPSIYRDATESEYQQYLIDYQKYLDDNFPDTPFDNPNEIMDA